MKKKSPRDIQYLKKIGKILEDIQTDKRLKKEVKNDIITTVTFVLYKSLVHKGIEKKFIHFMIDDLIKSI